MWVSVAAGVRAAGHLGPGPVTEAGCSLLLKKKKKKFRLDLLKALGKAPVLFGGDFFFLSFFLFVYTFHIFCPQAILTHPPSG